MWSANPTPGNPTPPLPQLVPLAGRPPVAHLIDHLIDSDRCELMRLAMLLHLRRGTPWQEFWVGIDVAHQLVHGFGAVLN